MKPVEEAISELESRRKTLNEELMNSKTTREANRIERELWALRAAIRYRKRLGERAKPDPSSALPCV